jgi:hypothetical protein
MLWMPVMLASMEVVALRLLIGGACLRPAAFSLRRFSPETCLLRRGTITAQIIPRHFLRESTHFSIHAAA